MHFLAIFLANVSVEIFQCSASRSKELNVLNGMGCGLQRYFARRCGRGPQTAMPFLSQLSLEAPLCYPEVCFGFLKAKWKVVWSVASVFDLGGSTVLESPPSQEYSSEIVRFPLRSLLKGFKCRGLCFSTF